MVVWDVLQVKNDKTNNNGKGKNPGCLTNSWKRLVMYSSLPQVPLWFPSLLFICFYWIYSRWFCLPNLFSLSPSAPHSHFLPLSNLWSSESLQNGLLLPRTDGFIPAALKTAFIRPKQMKSLPLYILSAQFYWIWVSISAFRSCNVNSA